MTSTAPAEISVSGLTLSFYACTSVCKKAQLTISFGCSVSSVCVYLNKYGKVGPHLDQQRIQQLPDHFGPGRASSVLQQCVQACVDSAYHQATVFACLKSGQGGEIVSGDQLFKLA